MARPLKDEAERKSIDLRVPVTAEQKRLIAGAAQSVGLDMATWARPILLKEAQKLVKQSNATSR